MYFNCLQRDRAQSRQSNDSVVRPICITYICVWECVCARVCVCFCVFMSKALAMNIRWVFVFLLDDSVLDTVLIWEFFFKFNSTNLDGGREGPRHQSEKYCSFQQRSSVEQCDSSATASFTKTHPSLQYQVLKDGFTDCSEIAQLFVVSKFLVRGISATKFRQNVFISI